MANSLTPFDPFREIDQIHERMSRLFSDGPGRVLPAVPPTDIYEEDGRLVIETALPQFKEEDVDVSLHNGRLEVRAEHRESDEQKKRNYLRRESSVASYYRVFQLPENVDPESVDAAFEDGMLRVALKQKEESKPMRIALKGRKSKKEDEK